MMKKVIKFLFISAGILLVLAASGVFVLYKMYPPAKLKMMVQQYVAENWHRELAFEDISFTWIGFTLTHVALSENTTFQEGTFVKADQLTAHVAVKPLFHKRLEISKIEADGLQINIVEKKDGTFNFDSLLSAEHSTVESEAEPSSKETAHQPLVLTADKVALTDCDITYQNERTGLKAAVNDLNVAVHNFDLANPFDILISFTTSVSALGQKDITVPVKISLNTFLAGLDLSQAAVSITQVSMDYQTVKLNLTGDIKNFQNPSVNITGTLTGITNQVFASFAPDLPNFQLPSIGLMLQAQADLEASTAQIMQARLSVQDSFLTANGMVNWGKDIPSYQLDTSLQADIEQIVKMTDRLDGFKPGGVIKGHLKATEKKNNMDVSGTVTLKDLSVFYDPVTLTQTSGTISLASLESIFSSGITGKLNDHPFTLSFSYKDIQNVCHIVLDLNLEKLVLTHFPASQEDTKDTVSKEGSSDRKKQETDSKQMNIQAHVTIGGIEIPYLQAEGFALTARLSGVTDTMSQANGSVGFALKPGKITNLDNFIKDSKIAKVVLLPVAVVKKVSGLLKLNLFPKEDAARSAGIPFTLAEGQYTFTDGIMNLDKTVFNSSVTNITASGTANFKTQELAMKAKATLLTDAAPVNIKITGTMSDPKGKLDVVNTVTSVMEGILNGTAAKSVANTGVTATKGTAKLTTDTVKGTVDTATDLVKGIGGLFKKKKAEE